MMMLTQLRRDLEFIEEDMAEDMADSLSPEVSPQMTAFAETISGETYSLPSAERDLPNFPPSPGRSVPDFLEMSSGYPAAMATLSSLGFRTSELEANLFDPSPLQHVESRSMTLSNESPDASTTSRLAGLSSEIVTLRGTQGNDQLRIGCTSLLIVHFPSRADDNWLHQSFAKMGFNVSSVIWKCIGKNKKFPTGKNIFAFVNHNTIESAMAMKLACAKGRIKLADHNEKVWTVSADWANQSR
jgi:hypothetical protein